AIVGPGPQQSQTLASKKVDLIEHDFDILALLLEQSSTPLEAGEKFLELAPLVTGYIVQLEKLADLAQAEAKPFTAQSQLQAHAVALRKNAVKSFSLGTEQSLIFVVAYRPRGNAKLLGQFGNGVRNAHCASQQNAVT